jgi:23S rRNA pseudouridine2605 synthase
VRPEGRDQYRPSRKPKAGPKPKEEGVRLNKYLAHAGIASRREADKLISAGLVKINGKVVTELGTKVMPADQVTYGGEKVKKEALRYVLLNKPKDFITTAKDPQNRRTVLELIGNACKERVLPVGRLDRNTTGVLLFTNDGEMAKKLTHPRYRTKKVYQVTLDKPLSSADMQKIREGLKLEEGTAQVDEISYLPNEPKTVVGLEVHIGWNRIVRRIFESLGYKVLRLDRTFFAGLTKKNLKRGQWRFLTEEEINRLKMIS